MSTTEEPTPGSPNVSSQDTKTEKQQFKRNKRITGTVKWYNAKDGYGFITRHDTGEDVFIHKTSIFKSNRKHFTRSVADGEEVEFGLIATKVTGPGGKPVQGSQFVAQRGLRDRRKRRDSNSSRRYKKAREDGRKKDVVGDGLQTDQAVKEMVKQVQNLSVASPPAEEPEVVNDKVPSEPNNPEHEASSDHTPDDTTLSATSSSTE